MTLLAVILCISLIGQVFGVRFVLPITGSNWTDRGTCHFAFTDSQLSHNTRPLSTGPNSIEWIYEKGSPEVVNIQLLHNNNESFQPIHNLLDADGVFAPGLYISGGLYIFTPSW